MPRYIPRFKRAKQISKILPEVLSEKNLEIPRPELKAFFSKPELPVITSWTKDKRTFAYICDCFTSTRLLSRRALEDARNGSTVVFYAERIHEEIIIFSLLRLLFNELNNPIDNDSTEKAFFDAIPHLKSELSNLDFRIGKPWLFFDVWSSMNELQDDLLDIINEPISKNVCCFISWIGDFDYASDKITMIEKAGFMYIVDQLTTFAKNNDCKMTIGGFQGSMPIEILQLIWRNS